MCVDALGKTCLARETSSIHTVERVGKLIKGGGGVRQRVGINKERGQPPPLTKTL